MAYVLLIILMAIRDIFILFNVSHCVLMSRVYFSKSCSTIIWILYILINLIFILLILIELIIFYMILSSILMIVWILGSYIIEFSIVIARHKGGFLFITIYSISIAGLHIVFIYLIKSLIYHISILKNLWFSFTIIFLKFIIFLLINHILK